MDNKEQKGAPEVHFRPARHEDYEAVMAIGDVNSGLDHLRSYYHDYLNNPNRFCYIAEINRKTVTFMMLYVVDDGEAVAAQAGRTLPKFEGLGIIEKIIFHGSKQLGMSGKFPNLKRVYSTSTNLRLLENPKTKNIIPLITNAMNLKVPKAFLDGKLTPAFLEPNIQEEMSVHEIQKLSLKDSLNVLNNQENRERLFPSGYFVCAMEPFKVMDSNFELVLRESHVFANKADDDSCTSLSFGKLRNARIGARYDLDIFGADDLRSILRHIIKHLLYVKSCNTQCDIHIQFTFGGPVKRHGEVVEYLTAILGLELGPRLGKNHTDIQMQITTESNIDFKVGARL